MTKRKPAASPKNIVIFAIIMIGVVTIALFSFLLQKSNEAYQRAVAADPALSVNGTTLVTASGNRFVIEGVNMEYYRDSGCDYVTEQTTLQEDQIVAKLKSIGVNAVRLNYRSSWLSTGSNINDYLTLAQKLAQNGIYVMPSDHSYTGKNLTGYETTSFPMFKAIVEGARSRGFEDYLIFNPYNEPYGADSTSTWPNWITANKATLDYLRNDLSFKGIIVLDTKGWASSFDLPSLQTMISYDATLTGGQAKLVFSNHWYPNHDFNTRVKPTFDASNQVPLVIGELGRINPGTTGVVDSYPQSLVDNLVSTAIPNGHNGVFPWMWAWCDENNMTADWDDLVNLSSYGQMYVDHYYSKIDGGTAPIPSIAPTSPSSTAGSGTCKQVCNYEDPDMCPNGSEWAGWQASYSNNVVTVCTQATTAPTLKPVVNPTPTPTPTIKPTVAPTASPKPTVAPTPTPTPTQKPTTTQGTGDGLTAKYYNNKDLTSLAFTRVDQTINFNWNYGSPQFGTMGPDTFSVEWSGFVTVPANGDYTFSSQSDDGQKLWVNNNLIINDWKNHSFTEKWATVKNMQAGKKYPIKLQYYENSGSAAIKLFWQGPSTGKQIIPSTYLFTQ